MSRTLTDIQNELNYLSPPDERHYDECHSEGEVSWYHCEGCEVVFRDHRKDRFPIPGMASNYHEECETGFHKRIDDWECTCEFVYNV